MLRRLVPEDAGFALRMVNDPSWLRFIGDRNVRSLEEARRYLEDGPIAMYARCGFGMYLVARRSDGEPLGFCGLLDRESLGHPDLGFALLPAHRSQGYAFEAARALLDHERRRHAIRRVVAITAPGNVASGRLLARLGFTLEGPIRMPPLGDTVLLYASDPA